MRTPAVPELFDAVASTIPGGVALTTPRGRTSYADLRDGSRAVAARLAGLGCRAGERIAIVARDHASIVAAILGVLRAGGVYAPLEPVAGPDLARRLEALACRMIVADAAGLVALGHTRSAIALDGAHPASPGPSRVPDHAAVPDAACSIYFTSGSTGHPRAILGRVAGLSHHLLWERTWLGAAAQRGAILHAPSYDAYLPDVFVPLLAGGTALAPPGSDPASLCRWLADEQITLLHCVPSLFRSLLAEPAIARTQLQAILLAGEVVRPSDIRVARAVLGDRPRIVNLYGPTEATLVKLHHEITPEDLERPTIPIGRPMPGVTVHVLDDARRPVVDGELGELAIQSRYGSLGYVDEPALTRARFVPAWDGTMEQVYLTGDLGRRNADGTYSFVGRRDRQIKLCGARVDLDEVEAILASAPGIVEAAVVPDPESTILHGFVVLAAGARLAEVRAEVMPRLSPAMRLARLEPRPALPRTASGKVDRRALTAEAFERHASGGPA